MLGYPSNEAMVYLGFDALPTPQTVGLVGYTPIWGSRSLEVEANDATRMELNVFLLRQ